MENIKNMQRLSDILKIDPQKLEELDVVNPFISYDLHLHIHPKLLEESRLEEFKSSSKKLDDYFQKLLTLIKSTKIRSEKDPFYKAARKIFDFPENKIKGIGLGTAKDTVNGTGLSGLTAQRTLETIYDIVDSGIEDIEILQLLSIFQDNIGVDRISDMISTIIYEDILSYSQRIYKSLTKLELSNFSYGDITYKVIMRDDDTPLLLVPKSIVSDIPIATSRDEIYYVVSRNEEVRKIIDRRVLGSLTDFRKISKSTMKKIFLSNSELFRQVIELVKTQEISPYDFEKDNLGLINPMVYLNEYLSNYTFVKVQKPMYLFDFVKELIDEYNFLIDKKNIKTELYDDKGNVKREVVSHKLFLIVAYTAKKYNLFDFTFEPNVGNGSVEFRFSNLTDVVVVEFKLSTHSRLADGYIKQLQDYMDCEKTEYGIYVIISVEPKKSLASFYRTIGAITDKKPVIVINAIRGKSSSML